MIESREKKRISSKKKDGKQDMTEQKLKKQFTFTIGKKTPDIVADAVRAGAEEYGTFSKYVNALVLEHLNAGATAGNGAVSDSNAESLSTPTPTPANGNDTVKTPQNVQYADILTKQDARSIAKSVASIVMKAHKEEMTDISKALQSLDDINETIWSLDGLSAGNVENTGAEDKPRSKDAPELNEEVDMNYAVSEADDVEHNNVHDDDTATSSHKSTGSSDSDFFDLASDDDFVTGFSSLIGDDSDGSDNEPDDKRISEQVEDSANSVSSIANTSSNDEVAFVGIEYSEVDEKPDYDDDDSAGDDAITVEPVSAESEPVDKPADDDIVTKKASDHDGVDEESSVIDDDVIRGLQVMLL